MPDREYSENTDYPDPDVEWVRSRGGNLWTRWMEYTDRGLTEFRGIVGECQFGAGYWWQIWRDGDDWPLFVDTAPEEESAMADCEDTYEYWLTPYMK